MTNSSSVVPALVVGIGLIPALDVADAASADRIVTATRGVPGVVGYKVGLSTVLELGLPAAIGRIRGLTDHPVVYDHQKAGFDVPSNATAFARTLHRAGVDEAILFPVAGPSTATAYISALQDAGISPIVGGELPVPDFTRSGGGWVDDDALVGVVHLALGLGVTRFVAPLGPRVARVVAAAEAAGVRPSVLVPGIRSAADVAALAPLQPRADLRVVVGRAITQAGDPQAAAAGLLAHDSLRGDPT